LQLPRGATATLLGPGSIEDGNYVAPAHLETQSEAIIIASRAGAAGAQRLTLLPAPPLEESLASVDAACGITLYDRATLERRGTFATNGSPADAAYGDDTLFWALATGTAATRYRSDEGLAPLTLGPQTSALLYDASAGMLVQADRDLGNAGSGAVTVLEPNGATHRILVGDTPEGLALLGGGNILVTNTNGGTVVEVNVRERRAVRTLRVGDRPFGVAVDPTKRLAFVALNSIEAMRASRAGGVVEIDVRAWRVRRVRHDAGLALGVAVDSPRRRLFVTEEIGGVLVLDEELRSLRPPLHPCGLPWLPTIDLREQRLFVPCPRENSVVVYDLTTLRVVARMTTSTYPLRVVLPPW